MARRHQTNFPAINLQSRLEVRSQLRDASARARPVVQGRVLVIRVERG